MSAHNLNHHHPGYCYPAVPEPGPKPGDRMKLERDVGQQNHYYYTANGAFHDDPTTRVPGYGQTLEALAEVRGLQIPFPTRNSYNTRNHHSAHVDNGGVYYDTEYGSGFGYAPQYGRSLPAKDQHTFQDSELWKAGHRRDRAYQLDYDPSEEEPLEYSDCMKRCLGPGPSPSECDDEGYYDSADEGEYSRLQGPPRFTVLAASPVASPAALPAAGARAPSRVAHVVNACRSAIPRFDHYYASPTYV